MYIFKLLLKFNGFKTWDIFNKTRIKINKIKKPNINPPLAKLNVVIIINIDKLKILNIVPNFCFIYVLLSFRYSFFRSSL